MGNHEGHFRTVFLIELIFAGLFLLNSTPAFGLNPGLDVAQYAHTAWRIREGFSRGFIYSIAQTPDGYLWLGTEFGLLRFDGVRNVIWQPPRGQHLPSDTIMSLLAAGDGTLWIGTRRGLASWKGGSLTQYPELAEQTVVTLVEDREGAIWAGTWTASTGRLCMLRNSTVRCSGADGALGHGVFNLFEDSRGNLWAGVQDGLWQWKVGPPKFYALPDEPNGIRGLAEDENGALLIGFRGGIKRLSNGKIDAHPLPNTVPQFQTRRILRDHDGGLWIATQGRGLVHLHQGKADTFARSNGLTGDDVLALFEDRERNIWVATLNGLDRFREFSVATLTENEGLSTARAGSVLADSNGNVWLGTTGGLNRWTNGGVTVFGDEINRNALLRNGIVRFSKDGKLNGLIPETLYEDSRGRIWVSTRAGVGYLENQRFVPISLIPGGIVHSIVEDSEGNIWIANQDHGLLRFSPKSEIQQVTWASLGHEDYATVLAAEPARRGLWLGFVLGGVAYFSDGKILESYGVSDGLGEGRVNAIRSGQESTLWVATEGGLSRLKNKKVVTLASASGLPCDQVHWSTKDDAGSLWMYMSCGLVRVERSELDIWTAGVDANQDKKGKGVKGTIRASLFDDSDGVRGLAVPTRFSPSFAKSSDGRLWFLPVDGVSVVDPNHLPFNSLPPPVHIEQINADRKAYIMALGASGDGQGRLRLPPLTRELEIDYTALSLAASEKVMFRYKLEGFDGDWQEAGNRRQAFYTNLAPREYRFRVRACNNSGVWNEEGASVEFAIAPSYYQTTWFRGACIAILLLLLAATYKLRLRQLARQFHVRLEERVSERTRIARDLHDTLLQSVQALLLRLTAVSDLLAAGDPKQRLDRAIDQTAQAIAEGRDAVQGLRSSTTVSNELAAALNSLAQELAASLPNQNCPVFHVEIAGGSRELHPIVRDEVYRIASEALRNAFQHAQASRIESIITYGDHDFRVQIRDNGKGIDPRVLADAGRTGHWGLNGMQERAKVISGKLELRSDVQSGTFIELTIPASISYGTSKSRRRFWLFANRTATKSGEDTRRI